MKTMTERLRHHTCVFIITGISKFIPIFLYLRKKTDNRSSNSKNSHKYDINNNNNYNNSNKNDRGSNSKDKYKKKPLKMTEILSLPHKKDNPHEE